MTAFAAKLDDRGLQLANAIQVEYQWILDYTIRLITRLSVDVRSALSDVNSNLCPEFNYLVKLVKGVITDSGGSIEEKAVLGISCTTLHDKIERPDTITFGTNKLIDTGSTNLPPALTRLMTLQWKKGEIPQKCSGKATDRVVKKLERVVADRSVQAFRSLMTLYRMTVCALGFLHTFNRS